MQNSHIEPSTKKIKQDHVLFTNEENKRSARPDEPSSGKHITGACQMHMMCETKMNIVLSWAISLLEQPLDAGLHALITVRYILPCRLLEKAAKAKIDEIRMLILLQQTMRDPKERTVEYHNRSLHFPDKWVKIVKAMRRFKRSYIPRREAPRYVIAIHYCQGRLEWISEDCHMHVHHRWRLLMERVTPLRVTIRQDLYPRQLAKTLIGHEHENSIIRNHTTLAGRSTSQPRIRRNNGSTQRRSKSWPRT